MPSYMTLVVFGLVASNVSPALSAPIRRVREQSLSHRGPAIEAAAGKKSWGPALKKYGKEFLIGTGATMAFAYAFEKLNGSGSSSKESSTPSTTSATAGSSNTANNANNPAYPAYSTSTSPTYSPSNYPTYSTSTGPTYSPSNYPTYSTSTGPTYSPSNYPTYSTSTSPTYSPSNYPTYSTSTSPTYSTPTYPTYPTSTNPPAQTQNGYQQRAVGRDLHADIFEAGSTSDNNNQNRQAASLDLLGRADLVEAIRLFSRMLDELD